MNGINLNCNQLIALQICRLSLVIHSCKKTDHEVNTEDIQGPPDIYTTREKKHSHLNCTTMQTRFCEKFL